MRPIDKPTGDTYIHIRHVRGCITGGMRQKVYCQYITNILLCIKTVNVRYALNGDAINTWFLLWAPRLTYPCITCILFSTLFTEIIRNCLFERIAGKCDQVHNIARACHQVPVFHMQTATIKYHWISYIYKTWCRGHDNQFVIFSACYSLLFLMKIHTSASKISYLRWLMRICPTPCKYWLG